jgi:hypothetical protein
MMIPLFPLTTRGLLLFACLLLVSPTYAQEVMVPSSATNPTAAPNLPSFDNPPRAAQPDDQKTEAPLSTSSSSDDTDPGPVTKYVKPTWTNLLKAMIHYNAMDIDDSDILNEYAEVSDCDVFMRFYQNDFSWHKIQEELRTYLRQSEESLPTFFHYDTVLQFGHYDFDKNLYFFTDKTKIKNVNSFLLLNSTQSPCPKVGSRLQSVPHAFHAVIGEPVGLYGIPMKSNEASALYDLMTLDKNTDHLIYARFNVHITYIAPMEKRHQNGISGKMIYYQMGNPATSVRFDSTLDSIDFYEDMAMTRPVFHYAPDAAPEKIPSKPVVPAPDASPLPAK